MKVHITPKPRQIPQMLAQRFKQPVEVKKLSSNQSQADLLSTAKYSDKF